jgi:hypothetical protein
MSAYCTQADVEAFYGPANVRAWASLTNNESSADVATRIAAAIETACAEIDDSLRGGPYTVPFSDAPDAPKMIKRAAVLLTGVELYSARGSEDFDPKGQPVNRLSAHEAKARRIIAEIHSRRLRLEIDVVATTTAPETISVDTPRDEENNEVSWDGWS